MATPLGSWIFTVCLVIIAVCAVINVVLTVLINRERKKQFEWIRKIQELK
jgi:hypothetical protein